MTRSRIVLLLLLVLVALAGCRGGAGEVATDPTSRLVVTFDDPRWTGEEVPVVGRCRDCRGQGMSPALRISGLPSSADEVVVEFNDLRVVDLARHGGHGTLSVATGGASEVVLPSVREETMDLPAGVRCVRPHRCGFYGHAPGAYKAPCGCGQGNEYVAVVSAVKNVDGKQRVLAEGRIRVGFF